MRPPADLFIILDRHRQMTALDKGSLADDLAAILAEEVLASMNAQQAPDGSPWAELSERYRLWKDAKHPGLPIGELLGKLKSIENIEGSRHILFDRVYIFFGVDDEVRLYGRAFNDGRPESNQPARPFIGFSRRCQERMAECIRQHLGDGLRAH